MNRQIKFKFWDLDTEQWVHPSEMEFCSNPDNGESFIGLPFNLYWKNIQYCQFTGLLDKNGNEIYEGDVLKQTLNNHYWIHLVEMADPQFGNQLFAFTYKDNLSEENEIYTFKERVLENKFRTYIPSGNNVEIIGNIFENPDLIKESN